MQNEQNRNYSNYEPWNQETYRTGSTKPPKSRGGLIAVLLVLVILLCGVITLLGVMNIRLFQQISASKDAETLPIVFSNDDENTTPASIDPSQSTQADPAKETTDAVSLRPTPESIANIPQEGGLALQEIYENVIDSVVSISCSYSGGISTGTGVILTGDGYIVTNCHVVEDAQRIQVQLTDGRNLDASLVGLDAISDLAVLLVNADGLIPAQLGDSSSLRVGDSVVAIGDPLCVELRGTMTDGIISAINRDIDVEGRIMNLIQTNAALNSGNSGGPLFNMKGEVIGITTAKYSGTSSSGASIESIGFAIPMDDVLDKIQELINNGYVSSPYMGISVDNRMGIGAYVVSVEPGSSAQNAGIRAGDIIIALGEHDIESVADISQAMRSFKVGDTTTVSVFRGRQIVDLSITFAEKPHSNQSSTQTPTGGTNMPSDGDYQDWWDYFFGDGNNG